jgi:copper homeostasis protein
MLLEIAIDSLQDALAAVEAGADRLEVCDRLDLGGLTPPTDLVRTLADRTPVPLFVMIRPRGGDFVYSSEEYTKMEREMDEAARAGAHGFVLGILTPQGDIDRARTGPLVQRAGRRPVTFHRAFDRCSDLHAGAERLARLGVQRILTSGGQASAEAGIDALRELQRTVGGKIGILPGGGVRPGNVRRLVQTIGVSEIHSAARNADGTLEAALVAEMKAQLRFTS